MPTRRYRVLDQIVEISAPKERWLSDVEKSLARFCAPAEDLEATLTMVADANSIEAFDSRGAHIKQRVLNAEDNPSWLLKAVTTQCLLNSLAKAHDILHGSAVVAHEKAHLFIGGSGSGKTTLSLELVRRGYALLCEGQIPVSRETGLAQPFPRGLESESRPDEAEAFASKHLKKTRPLTLNVHMAPCAVASVFFLEDIFPGTDMQAFIIACPLSKQAALSQALSRLPVSDVKIDVDAGICVARFNFQPSPAFGLNELHAKINKSCPQVDLIRSAKVEKPQWSWPVSIEEVSAPKAALGLGANCFAHARTDESPNGKNILNVFSGVLKNAEAYLLRCGSVDERARCVIEIIEQKVKGR
jgi:hypothetical protein